MFFRKLLKLPYHIRDLIDYSRAFSRREHTDMYVKEVDDDAYLIAAKKLHASVYLGRGFVQETDVDEGMLSLKADPHQLHSKYFVVVDKRGGRVIATSRQIESTKSKKHESFAIVGQAHLYPSALKRIKSQLPEHSVEISGLAKWRGISKLAPLLLYRAMWHRSLRSGHRLWLLAIDTKLFVRLKLLFGPTIQRAGKVTPYYGGDVVPAILNVQASLDGLKDSLRKASVVQRPLRSAVIRFMLNGLPVDSLNASEKHSYEDLRAIVGFSGKANESYTVLSTRFKVLAVAIAASLIYTVVRFFIVKLTLQDYGVNPWLFLVLDAIAGTVYVVAVERLIANIIRKQKSPLRAIIAWTALATVTFMAPYAYIFLASREFSPSITIGLGVLVLLLAVNAITAVRNKVRKKIAE